MTKIWSWILLLLIAYCNFTAIYNICNFSILDSSIYTFSNTILNSLPDAFLFSHKIHFSFFKINWIQWLIYTATTANGWCVSVDGPNNMHMKVSLLPDKSDNKSEHFDHNGNCNCKKVFFFVCWVYTNFQKKINWNPGD